MPYTPDALDDTQPNGATVPAKTAAAEFRAIKTVLIAHEEAITDTIPAALAGLDVRLDSYEATTSLRNRQWLTGSGNFTVPAGVTTLYISIAAGGRAGFALLRSSPGTGYTLEVDPEPAKVSRHKLTVVPADIIAYSVGADEVISRSLTTVSQGTAAAASTFGSLTSFPERQSQYREQHNASSAFTESYPTYLPVDMAQKYPITLTYAPTSETLYQGAGSHILVEW